MEIEPPVLWSQEGATHDKARFATEPGVSPRISGNLRVRPGLGIFNVKLEIDQILFSDPELCLGEPATARLHFEFEIDDGFNMPETYFSSQDWQCVTGRDGAIRRLQAVAID